MNFKPILLAVVSTMARPLRRMGAPKPMATDQVTKLPTVSTHLLTAAISVMLSRVARSAAERRAASLILAVSPFKDMVGFW